MLTEAAMVAAAMRANATVTHASHFFKESKEQVHEHTAKRPLPLQFRRKVQALLRKERAAGPQSGCVIPKITEPSPRPRHWCACEFLRNWKPMVNDAAVVILAAGQGTRMKSRMAKVLHRAGGKALVEHAIDAAKALAPAERIFVVVGHQAEAVGAVARDLGVGTFIRRSNSGRATL